MHPLVVELGNLKDSEIEIKITELSKKYFQTQNPYLQGQILSVLEAYKDELSVRRHNDWVKMNETRDKGLDKLINID